MTITKLIDLLRKQCYVEASQMDDDELLMYLNLAYHDLENTITSRVNENFFWQSWKTPLVDWQDEYTFQPSTSTTEGFKKILQVEVKYDPDSDSYEKLPHENVQLFDSARDVLANLTPNGNGFYDLKDSSLFLYPSPSEDVTDGLKITGIVNLVDLNSTDIAETFIFPEHSDIRQYIPMIALWAKQYVYWARGMLDAKNDSINEYDKSKSEMVRYLSNRDIDFVEQVLPNLDYLK